MKITYDSEADAMRIKFQEGKYEVSEELRDGIIVVQRNLRTCLIPPPTQTEARLIFLWKIDSLAFSEQKNFFYRTKKTDF